MTLEEQAFRAILDGDFQKAEELLKQLLPKELKAVIHACNNLKEVAWDVQAEAEVKP